MDYIVYEERVWILVQNFFAVDRICTTQIDKADDESGDINRIQTQVVEVEGDNADH